MTLPLNEKGLATRIVCMGGVCRPVLDKAVEQGVLTADGRPTLTTRLKCIMMNAQYNPPKRPAKAVHTADKKCDCKGTGISEAQAKRIIKDVFAQKRKAGFFDIKREDLEPEMYHRASAFKSKAAIEKLWGSQQSNAIQHHANAQAVINKLWKGNKPAAPVPDGKAVVTKLWGSTK